MKEEVVEEVEPDVKPPRKREKKALTKTEDKPVQRKARKSGFYWSDEEK